MIQAPCPSPQRKTFALLTTRVLSTTSYTRPLSLPHSMRQEFILAWQSIVSKRGSTTTRFLLNIASTRAILSYPSPSGTLRTATPVSRASGPLPREQVFTGRNSLHYNLCLTKNLCILSADRSTLLIKRSKLIIKCRYASKVYAANQKQDRSTQPPLLVSNLTPTAVNGTV